MRMRSLSRCAALSIVVVLFAGACSFGGDSGSARTLDVRFSRAVQMFPGNSVRVLGVTVGRVTDVRLAGGSAEVEIRIDDPDVKLPADVRATIVPVSLLGERYIQLFPAYEGGATFEEDLIDEDRTSVPAEQDELLRGLQDYFGALDEDKVADFVTNAAHILEGNGEGLNRLIDEGSSVISTLNSKRESLAGLIRQLNTLTLTLSTRQDALARVIHSYNAVSRALNEQRDALEGTIEGLSRATTQLASLLVAHRDPLGADVRTLTRTMRTLSRNANKFARTGKWAKRLFNAASKAVDYEQDWLRLSNQGQPLFELIALRLEDRLQGVCLRLEIDECSSDRYWENRFPDMFCIVEGSCDSDRPRPTPGEAFDDILDELPDEVREELRKDLKDCKDAKHPKRCRAKKKEQTEGDQLDEILDGILDQVDGTGSLTGGGGLDL